MSKNWFPWHDNYRTRPRMWQCLPIVWEYIATFLNQSPARKITVISVCAGDSRDLIGALLDYPRTAGNMGVGMHCYLGETLPLPDGQLFVFSSPLDAQDAWLFH
jgi:hypothetical protein